MSARRVMLVVYRFDSGGSERLAGQIAEDLHERGHGVTVCATHGGPGPLSRALEAQGIPCIALDGERHGRLARRWALWRLFRRERPHVLHVQHLPILELVYRPARLAGVRRIHVTEHTDAHLVGDRRLQRRVARLGRAVDAVTVIHAGLRRFLVETVGLPSGQVRLVPNGVDTARFAPADPEPRLRAALGAAAADDVVIGCVARLHPDKDHATLIDAAARLARAGHTGFHLVLIGDGEERTALERQAAAAGIGERVRLLGDRDDVAALVPQLDLFVLPSRTEGLPMVLLEAMSAGVACVATRVGGIPELLADGVGVLVPPADPPALAAAIGGLLDDPQRRRALGRRGRERVRRQYDLRRTMAAYRRLLLAEPAPGSGGVAPASP